MIGSYDQVLIPRGSTKTDWEVEQGVVIGESAATSIQQSRHGRTCPGTSPPMMSRDPNSNSKRSGQWNKGKSCETFNSLGPVLVTTDHVSDSQAMSLTLAVNGVKRQNATPADMVFGVDHVIWYLSPFLVLEPRDLINTCTPAGVALGHQDLPSLRADDVFELEVDVLVSAGQTFGRA